MRMITFVALATLSLNAHSIEYVPDPDVAFDIIQMHDTTTWEKVCQSYDGVCDVPEGTYQVKLLDRNWKELARLRDVRVQHSSPQGPLGADAPDQIAADLLELFARVAALEAAVAALQWDGQTIGVTISGVSGHVGHDLAGVLYTGGELANLDHEALGGFWSMISGEDFTTTEVIRQPGDLIGRFPFVSDEALTVEPGTYTLVLWVDFELNSASRWVPINTDGFGLYGCHVVFEVAADTQTNIEVTPKLHPDGWNINCTTGQAIPGT